MWTPVRAEDSLKALRHQMRVTGSSCIGAAPRGSSEGKRVHEGAMTLEEPTVLEATARPLLPFGPSREPALLDGARGPYAKYAGEPRHPPRDRP